MSLLDWIHNVGSKLRIVQIDPEPCSAPDRKEPAAISTKCFTLAQLMREIANRDVQALSALPAELSLPFGTIFKAASVTCPAHGWDVEALRDLLAKEPYCSLAGEELTRAVLEQLACDKAATDDLVRDAVGRDQALDAFEAYARSKLQERSDARRRKLTELRAKAAKLEDEIRCMEDEAASDRQEWRQWHRKKTDYEKMMAGALTCLLDRPIVTLDPDEE